MYNITAAAAAAARRRKRVKSAAFDRFLWRVIIIAQLVTLMAMMEGLTHV